MNNKAKNYDDEFQITGNWDHEEVDIQANWIGIQADLRKKKQRKRMYAVSSVAVCLAIVMIFLPEQGVEEIQPQISLSDVSPELAKTETNYHQVIQEKWIEIQDNDVDSAQVQFIYDELDLLTELEKEYQQELQEMGPNELIVQTMLKCYERRIQLLDLLMKEIQI